MATAVTTNAAGTYEQYLGPAIYVPWGQVLLEAAAPRAGERVLDLACGTGIVSRQLAPMLGAGGHVTGVDLSAAMLEQARSLPWPGPAGVDWVQADAAALPLPDATFSLAVCQQGLQFFPDRAAAVSEMRRVLTPGGRAVVSVWQGLVKHPVLKAIYAAAAAHLGVAVAELAVPFSLPGAKALAELLRRGGFSRVAVDAQELEVRFIDPDRFVEQIVLAATATVPALAQADAAAHEALVAAVATDTREVVRGHRKGRHVAFAMRANVAVARD